MIRTFLSICALFGALIFVSKWVHESGSAPVRKPQLGPAKLDKTEAPVSIHRPPAPLPSTRPQTIERGPDTAATQGPSIKLVSYDEAWDELFGESADGDDSSTDTEGETEEATEATNSDESETNESSESPSSKSTDPQIKMTPELLALRGKLRECLAHYYFRPENVATRSPWGTMHAMIAYGVDTQVIAGDRRVNAIGYLCYNGTCNRQRLFHTTNKRIQTSIGPGVQGHPAQFLAMLAQSRVKTDFPMVVDGQNFTVADLIQHEKETCRPASELTFKLIAFTHYLKSDEKWKSNDGQDWDIPRLIKEELRQPIHGAACGGTHRMTGFSYAVRKRESRGEPFEGQWRRAKKFVEEYHEYTFKLQNPDGSMSTDWFVRRADFGDHARRLQTTGHIAEWLAYSLKKDQLVEPRMVKTVDYLATLLLDHPNERWSIGPLGHGLHALAIYDERVFSGTPGKRAEQLAIARKDKTEKKAEPTVR